MWEIVGDQVEFLTVPGLLCTADHCIDGVVINKSAEN